LKKLKELLQNDALFRQSLEAELNAEMDRELAKSEAEMSLEKIEDLTEALLFLNGADASEERKAPPLLSRFKTRYLLTRYAKVFSAAAAAIALILLSYFVLQALPQEHIALPEETTTQAAMETTTVPPIPEDTSAAETTVIPESTTAEKPSEATEEHTAGGSEKATTQADRKDPDKNGKPVPVTGAELPDGEDDDSYYGAPQDDGTHYGSEPLVDVHAPLGPGNTATALYIGFKNGFRTQYNVGDALDVAHLTITVVYDDDSSRLLSVSECRITGFSGDTPGRKTVTVSYGDASESFTVTVE